METAATHDTYVTVLLNPSTLLSIGHESHGVSVRIGGVSVALVTSADAERLADAFLRAARLLEPKAASC